MRVVLATLCSMVLIFAVFLTVVGIAALIAGGMYLDSDVTFHEIGFVLVVVGLLLAARAS
jgi:hypothetical protein